MIRPPLIRTDISSTFLPDLCSVYDFALWLANALCHGPEQRYPTRCAAPRAASLASIQAKNFGPIVFVPPCRAASRTPRRSASERSVCPKNTCTRVWSAFGGRILRTAAACCSRTGSARPTLSATATVEPSIGGGAPPPLPPEERPT